MTPIPAQPSAGDAPVVAAPPAQVAGHERLHAVDAGRAAAMLLGVYLHAALAYRPYVGESWPVDDASESELMTLSVEIIHSFRMQLFFLLAGFFAALLLGRRGPRAFLANRGVRIAIPYAVGVVLLSPLCALAWIAAAGEIEYVTWRGLLSEIGGSWHLWFLRELLILSVIGCSIAVSVPARWRAAIGARVGPALVHPLAPLALIVPVFLTLLTQPWWGIHGPGVWPRWENVLHYGLFFTAGAALWPSRTRLAELGRRWTPYAIIGLLVAAPLHFRTGSWYWENNGFTLGGIADEPLGRALLVRAGYALMCVMLVYAFLGLFMRYFAHPNRAWRYVSDASYWIYLIHFPLMMITDRVVAPLQAPAAAKVVLSILIAIPILIGSYALFVRHSIIGRVLNGPPPGGRTSKPRPAPAESTSSVDARKPALAEH